MPPAITILVVTYNHEPYILQALNSIDMQDYKGPVRIIVADDYSTDNTVNIIKSFKFTRPIEEIKFLPNEKNFGITKNYQRSFAECNDEYIATLEGDDYWTNPHRLTAMVDILENHRECVLVSSNYFIFEEEDCRYTTRTSVDLTGFWRIDSRYIIFNNLPGNFSACVYRTSVIKKLPNKLFDIKSYDWIINICLGMHGFIAYMHEPMSTYRLHKKGTWSSMNEISKIESQLEVLDTYNLVTEGKFEEEFSKLKTDLRQKILAIDIKEKLHVTKGFSSVLSFVKSLIPPILLKIIKLILPPLITTKLRERI